VRGLSASPGRSGNDEASSKRGGGSPVAPGRALAVAGKGQHNVVMLVAEGSRTPVELKNERGRSMQTCGRITWR